MKVNIKKNKVLIFNKAGRKISEKFTLQNNILECISNNRYLGVYFTASGSFHQMRTELCNKALKANYKLRFDFLSLNPSIKTSLHIFDHTLKPILLYNSEIWGNIVSPFLNCAQLLILKTYTKTYDVKNFMLNF